MQVQKCNFGNKVFDLRFPFHTVSESRGGSLRVEDKDTGDQSVASSLQHCKDSTPGPAQVIS